MSRETDIAWAAGLFEGEGCISCGRLPHHIRLVLRMADRDVVERFHAIVGAGRLYATPRRPPRQLMWTWQANGTEAAQVVVLLLQYFGQRRMARAQELLYAFYEHVLDVTFARYCEFCRVPFQPPYVSRAGDQRFCSKQCRDGARGRGPLRPNVGA